MLFKTRVENSVGNKILLVCRWFGRRNFVIDDFITLYFRKSLSSIDINSLFNKRINGTNGTHSNLIIMSLKKYLINLILVGYPCNN